MIFCDQWFFSFLLTSVPICWATPKQLRSIIFLVACFFFHTHYAGQAGVIPIIVIAFAVFQALKSQSNLIKKSAIGFCIVALVYYKYIPFINKTIGSTFETPAIPLAISFFTFEFIHLLGDQIGKKIKKTPDLISFFIFTVFFPSLVSGPIKRIQQFHPQLEELGRPNKAILLESAVRILFGYFKKFCLSAAIETTLPPIGALSEWRSSIANLCIFLGLRIFLDFSGYSDIAIGIAGLFNIKLPENFSFPYLSLHLTEFWRRWHISLSSWIRDYVYIVLGGNRDGTLKKLIYLTVTMALCGLWHGGAYHFIVWGFLHGLGLVIHNFWTLYKPFKIPKISAWALTTSYVLFCWLFFFYDLPEIWALLQRSPWV